MMSTGKVDNGQRKRSNYRVDDISQAVQLEKKKGSWIPKADEYKKWPEGPRQAKKEGTDPAHGF